MEINGKITATPVKKVTKANQANDGSRATVDFEVPTSKKNAAKRFGADFQEIAFSTMKAAADKADGSIHLADSIKPGKHCRLGSHSITMEGETFTTTPRMTRIDTVDGDESVIAVLRIEIDTSKEDLMAAIDRRIRDGEAIPIECKPAQMKLGFAPDAGEKAMDGTKGAA